MRTCCRRWGLLTPNRHVRQPGRLEIRQRTRRRKTRYQPRWPQLQQPQPRRAAAHPLAQLQANLPNRWRLGQSQPSGAEQAGSEAPKLAANQRLAELLAILPPQFIDPSVAEKKKNVVLIPDATGGFTELPADVTHVAYAGTKVAVKQGLSTSGKLMQAVWRMIVFLMCAVMLMIVYYLLT